MTDHTSCSLYFRTIADDPEGFFEGGGWGFLDPNSDDEGEEGDPDDLEDSEDEEFKVRVFSGKSYLWLTICMS